MLNILVVGAGAIGCFVGGRLAAAGQNVTLVGRPALMQKIADQGLTLRHPALPSQTVHPETVTAIGDVSKHYDFILVTVKAPDTAEVIEQLAAANLPAENSFIVSLQNGVGNEELMAAAFSAERVIAGTITIPISVPEPGTIAASKDKGGLGLAPMHPAQPVRILADALTLAGLATYTYANYRAMKWSKLLLNIANNASSAILDESPVRIINNPQLLDMEIEAIAEGVQVMKRLKLSPISLPGYPVDWLARLVSTGWLPAAAKRALLRPSMQGGRGSKMPSLHLDLSAGRTTSEVDALNGAIARFGQRLGIATPVNETLTEILNGLVTGKLERSDYRRRPEKLLQAIAARREQAS